MAIKGEGWQWMCVDEPRLISLGTSGGRPTVADYIEPSKWGDGTIRDDDEPAQKSTEPLREDPQRGTGAPGPWHQIGRDDQPDPNTQAVDDGDCIADDICSTWYTFGHRGTAFTMTSGDTGDPVDPPNECAKCGVRYWRTQNIDDYCGPCSGGAGNLRDGNTYTFSGYTVVVAPKPLDHNPRESTRRIKDAFDDAMAKDAAMRESCPPRKVFLCDHCDRHHEGELQSVNVKLGAQYAVTCEATGLESMRWIPAEELWG